MDSEQSMRKLAENVAFREISGTAKEDLWAYLSLLLLVIGCVPSRPWVVATLFALSAAFMAYYQVVSFVKFASDEMATWLRLYGIVNNVAFLSLQFAAVGIKIWFLTT
jgi:hypothetical protein